jgi:phage baseplate assembly protein W
MRSFRVSAGDLVLTPGGRAERVEGEQKLVQEITLWLLEPLGTGFLTPQLGSVLHSLVGGADSVAAAPLVASEVERVLAVYQAAQLERVRAARGRGEVGLYSRREVLDAVEDVEAAAERDIVRVRARIRTGAGEALTLPVEVAPEAVEVPGAGEEL